MRKAIFAIICMVLMSSMALAQQNGQMVQQQDEPEQTMVQEKMRLESQAKGLENAMLVVKDGETRLHLERVLERIQAQHRERLNQLDNLEIEEFDNGDIIAEGRGQARFLNLIPMERQFRYTIMEDGTMQYRAQWYDNLFTFEPIGDEEEE